MGNNCPIFNQKGCKSAIRDSKQKNKSQGAFEGNSKKVQRRDQENQKRKILIRGGEERGGNARITKDKKKGWVQSYKKCE